MLYFCSIFPKNLSDELEIQMTKKPKPKMENIPSIDSPRIIKAISNLVSTQSQVDRLVLNNNRQRSNSSPITLSEFSLPPSSSPASLLPSSSSSPSSHGMQPVMSRSASQRARSKRYFILLKIYYFKENKYLFLPGFLYCNRIKTQK